MISTRGRYALRVMTELAMRGGDSYVPMKQVAERQGISLKYLEQILPALVERGLVDTRAGKGGGYRLANAPEAIPVGEILRATEKELAPVSCLVDQAEPCPRRSSCKTVRFWAGLEQVIGDYIDHVTLADLL